MQWVRDGFVVTLHCKATAVNAPEAQGQGNRLNGG
jgi:hypothetical protein